MSMTLRLLGRRGVHLLWPDENPLTDDDGQPGDWTAQLVTGPLLRVCGPKSGPRPGAARGQWPAAATLGATGAAGPAGALTTWTTGVAYATSQPVAFGRAVYQATAAHTAAASFYTDLLAGRWRQLSTTARCETVDPGTASAQTAVEAVNRMYFQRVTGSGAVSGAAVHVAAAAGNLLVAVYRNNGSEGVAAAPTGDPIATTGSVAASATGLLSMPFTGGNAAVADGDWFGISTDNVATLRLLSVSGATTLTGNAWQGRAGYVSSLTFPGTPTVSTVNWGLARGHYVRGIPV